MADIKQYFSAFIRQELLDNEIWCDTEHGDKIKWHLPFGVSYDILHGLSVEGAIWHLNVHFSDYPEQELLRCPSLDCVKSYFLTTLKEADALKHGSVSLMTIFCCDNAHSDISVSLEILMSGSLGNSS